MQLFSPAKINLSLRVLNKREDGYHNIASHFQTLDFGDYLSFSFSDKDQLTCNISSLCNSENLVTKAVALFKKKTGLSFNVRISLQKNIPMQAGLAGGSSNAATTLWGLNALLNTNIASNELAKWALELGSDVPFFFSRGTAFCEGRGEIITPLPFKANEVALFKPPTSLSTKRMYEQLKRSNERFPSRDTSLYVNDFEPAAFYLLPTLKTLKQTLLLAGYHTVLMTGSGTTFFALGKGKPVDIEGFTRYQVPFLQRKQDSWYESLQECLV